LSERARAKGIELACQVAPGVPSSVRGDPMRLRQVLTNLIGNGIKFTDAGRVALAVDCSALQQGQVRFTVSDTGIGIDAQARQHLFEPFMQADGSTTRKYGGTGLGLAISRQLVQMMGGDIDAESEPGRGSTFTFTITSSAEPVQAASDARETASTPSVAQPALDKRILLVEDNHVNQQLALTMLRHLGCTVELAVNGAEAVRKYAPGAFDLVLMDCQMPEMDGFEATALIRATGSVTPIVALTAKAMQGDRERCLEVGMDDYLSKPFRKQELRVMVERWTNRVGVRAACDHGCAHRRGESVIS
jgi:CheY-like chemotaxis protein